MNRRHSAPRPGQVARKALLRIAGMHRRSHRYFHCALIAEMEGMYIHTAEQLNVYTWGPPKPVRTVAVRIPRSLKPLFPNGLRSLAW